jgi:integrase
VTFGQINNSRLRSAVQEHYRHGQETLQDFVKWMIRHEGLSDKAARSNAAALWNALCLTWDHGEQTSHPENLLLSASYSKSMIYHLQGALSRWARHTKDVDLQHKIQEFRESKRPVVHTKSPPVAPKTYPYTPGEIEALLAATERFRDDPRWPWGWSVIRMIVIAGLSVSEIFQLTPDQIRRSLQSGSLVLWHAGRGSRSLPVDLVRPELEALLAWPWTWGSVVDIVSPVSSGPSRSANSTRRITELAKVLFERSGVAPLGRTWIPSCRWAATIRYYEITGNIVGAAHICQVRDIRRVQAEIEIMRQRQKERAKALGGKARRKRQSSIGPSPSDMETSDR